MSEEIVRASFGAKRSDINRMVDDATAAFDDKYDQAYINVRSDEINLIANAGTAVAAYSTYSDPIIGDIQVDDSFEESGSEAIIRVSEFKNYLNFVGGSFVDVEFLGTDDTDDRLARKIHLDGDLEATIYIPSSQSDLESKMLTAVDLYNDENEFIKPSNGETLSTSFGTNVEALSKIVEVADFDDIVLKNYPVVVENGKLMLHAQDKNDRNEVSGALYSENLEGPDVSNTYSRGFEELFSTIDGNVEVMIEQDSAISIVKDREGFTNRYAILPTS